MREFPLWIDETPTRGKFRRRQRNELFFAFSDKPKDRPGLYAFWTALIKDHKPYSRRPHTLDFVPGRALLGLPKTDRFTRMPLDALKDQKNRAYYRSLYSQLKKPLKVRRSTFKEIAWWCESHPELAKYAKCMEYRKHGVRMPWQS